MVVINRGVNPVRNKEGSLYLKKERNYSDYSLMAKSVKLHQKTLSSQHSK